MKKLFALFLALALLVPMAVPAQAEEIEKKPFYAVAWSDFDETKYPHLNGFVWGSWSNSGENAKLTLSSIPLVYGSYTDEDVTKLANKMKETMQARPEGSRYWYVHGPSKLLRLAPENAVFMDFYVDQMAELMDAALQKMKEINCPLDGIVVDTEYIGMSTYYLIDTNPENNPNNLIANPNLLRQIVADPRYKTELRPLLEEYGFVFYQADTPASQDYLTELYSLTKGAGDKYAISRDVWNTVIRIHLNRYCSQWAYEPLKKYYPDATCSDYQSLDSKPWFRLYESSADGVPETGGSSVRVGTNSTYSYYHNRPNGDFYEKQKQYASYNEGVFEQSPFNSFMSEVNFTRHMYASTDTRKISPWLCSYLYTRDQKCQWNTTAYYAEEVYHLGMFAPDPFLFYNTKNEVLKVGGEEGWDLVGQTLNAILAALTEVAGFADRKPIEMPQYWNAEYMVSGMYCGGRNLWRITPNTDEVSLEAFKVEGKDPTFSVKGQTITFPGGKILEDATIPNVGSCGYWVETAKDVTPIMTSDADRYEKYPAFRENFDAYEEGKLTVNNMAQPYAWIIRRENDNAAEAVPSGEGKALALTGNASFENIIIPTKITAGDSYAEEQTWQIRFTVPEGLSAEAEIYLLKYAGEGTELFDNGITIRDGKVYYSQVVEEVLTEEKELTTIKPGTYTLKRVMNFSDPDYFTYDVYLLNEKGKEIARVQNVPCPTFRAITSVLFFTRNADKAVLFDDYTLYASGLTTDFALYDATTGRNAVADGANAGNTAYRLSWLNGTDAEKTLEVVAAIYEGETLKEEKTIKTISMKPGCDAIDTGIVEAKEGQSVKVYLKGDVQTFENDTTPGEPVLPSGNNTILIIAIVAAVLIAACAVVIAIKKKKPAAQVLPAEETPAADPEAEDDPEEVDSDYTE